MRPTGTTQVDVLVLGTGAGGLAAAVTAANEGLDDPRAGKDRVPRRHHRLLRWHLLDRGQPVPAGRRRRRGGEPLPRRAGRRPRSARDARGLPCPRSRGNRLSGPDRRAVPALEDGRRLPPGDPRIRHRPCARAADLRRPDARQGQLRPRSPSGSRVRAVRRHADGAQARGQRPARDLPGFVRGMRTALRLGVRWAADRLRYPRGTRLAMGNALVANLFHQLLER